MQNEMNQLFAEGGVMQEGGTVDPVSGNDVPPGAMAEEVRDDIDAKLSEGEFVIPADVVRYIGLEKLMMMRDKAKAGLKRMADIGQMGNAEEVPDAEALHSAEDEMDDDTFSSEIDSIIGEGNEREFAKGGDVRKYQAGGFVGGETNKELYRDAPIRGFEMVAMTNDAGQTIYIPFINGKPQLAIPQGYRVRTSDVTATTTTPTVPTTPTGGGDSGGGDGGAPTGGGNTDGSAVGGGQGISNTAIDAGLAAMAFGQSTVGKAISSILGIPASTIANTLGAAVVDQQMDAISTSFGAMSDANTLGGQLGTVSDESGNISTVSNQAITDAFDQATFGTTSSQMSNDAAAAAAVADQGDVAEGGSMAANADAAAAAVADQGDVAEGGAMAANADAAAADAAAANAASAAVAADAMGGPSAGDSSGPGASDGSGPGAGAGTGGASAGDSGDGGTGAASSATGDDGGGGGGGGGGAGCFLTTAAVEHMGHTDNGQLLNTLRDFRDTYMRKNKEASKDVAWYYENAPKIVKALDDHPDAKKIYRKMYNRFIMPSYLAIKMGKDEVAYGLYKKGINFARQEAGIKNEDIEPRYGKHGTTDSDVKKHTGLGAKSKK
jgi:hypothetical protein